MEQIEKTTQLYEGKAKKVYSTNDPNYVIVSYKDDATALDGLKKGTIIGKGVINNKMSNHLCRILEEKGIPTHFVEERNDRETLVKKVSIVPLEVIIRNISAGSFAKRYGVEEGIVFDAPTIEFSYKNDELHDPLLNAYHARALGLATEEEIETIKRYAFRVNEILKAYFLERQVSNWWILRWNTADWRTARLCWQTRFHRTPADSGTARPTKSWIRTVSAAIWAASRTHITK